MPISTAMLYTLNSQKSYFLKRHILRYFKNIYLAEEQKLTTDVKSSTERK